MEERDEWGETAADRRRNWVQFVWYLSLGLLAGFGGYYMTLRLGAGHGLATAVYVVVTALTLIALTKPGTGYEDDP